LTAVVARGLVAEQDEQTYARLAAMHRVLLGGAALLLLLAAANAANLLASRYAMRRQELAIRVAVGASPARIVLELLTELTFIALLAAAVGLFGGFAMSRIFGGVMLLPSLPPVEDMPLSWTIAALAIFAGASAVCVSGVIPAWLASRSQPDQLRSGRLGRTSGLVRHALIFIQVAIAVALLGGAAVLVRSLFELRSVDYGFQSDRVLQVTLRPTYAKYSSQRSTAAFEAIVDEIGASGRIDAVAYARATLTTGKPLPIVRSLDAMDRVPALDNIVSADYFRVLRIPVLAGRTFTNQEVQLVPRTEWSFSANRWHASGFRKLRLLEDR
jgi:putative ABC transport system permease protein